MYVETNRTVLVNLPLKLVKCLFTPMGMAIYPKTKKGRHRSREIGTLGPCWWEYKRLQLLWKTRQFLKNTMHRIITWASKSTSGLDTQELKTGTEVSVHACSWQRYSQQPKVEATQVSSHEWMVNKMWSIRIMEQYSAWTWEEILTPATTQMNLEDFMLNDVSQTQRTNTVRFHSRWDAYCSQIHSDRE